jgi:hypothetical protein
MRRLSYLFWSFVIVLGLSVFVGCSARTMNFHTNNGLDGNSTSIIKSGSYTVIVGVDGQKVKSAFLNVAVSPGSHILSIAFVERAVGFKALYATQNASLSIVVKPGHRYTAYAEEVPESGWAGVVVRSYDWVAYVTDDEGGEKVAESEPLPLREEHIFFPSYRGGPLL